MKFELLTVQYLDEQWWFGLVGLSNYGDFDGHLFYIEWDQGQWKFDLLFLRSLVHALKDR